MKFVMIAALVAAQLAVAAGPAQAEERPREEPVTQPSDPLADSLSRTRSGEEVELALADGQSSVAPVENARVEAAQEDKPRKRKSTGDKVLTGAAVILGLGALAVGGLLVAIFVN